MKINYDNLDFSPISPITNVMTVNNHKQKKYTFKFFYHLINGYKTVHIDNWATTVFSNDPSTAV